ncbi:MAG: hypothetical protein ACR2PS_13265 [Pseudomonadales bacterium]
MEQEITIGVSIAVAVAVIFGIHSWLHKLVEFKIDESAILKFFEDSGSDCKSRSTNAISSGTDIPVQRVTVVCSNSKAIKRNSNENESWCLK